MSDSGTWSPRVEKLLARLRPRRRQDGEGQRPRAHADPAPAIPPCLPAKTKVQPVQHHPTLHLAEAPRFDKSSGGGQGNYMQEEATAGGESKTDRLRP
jgi:hypothetical protein